MKTRINSEPEKLASFPFVARRSSGKSSHSQSKKRRKVMSDSIDPARILNTGFGFWSSKVLLTAVELEVFTALSGTKLTGEELGNKLGLHRAVFGTSSIRWWR
jgi:hypothetical protein